MKSASHTPGPWTANALGSIRSANGWLVAEALHAESVDKGNANARLIAAAPEMYDTLDRIASGEFAPGVSLEEQVSSLRVIARAALAKAQGQ